MGLGADPLENGLTYSLPWLVALVIALVWAAVQVPRDPLPNAERMLIVGRPINHEAAIVADQATNAIGALTTPALFDLHGSDGTWLRLVAGGRVSRAAVTFDPELLQGQVDTKAILTGPRDLDVIASFPQPDPLAPKLLRVDVQAYRLFPPATWDTYFYRVVAETPEPLLTLRGEPALLITSEAADGAEVYGHEWLWRRNLQYVWDGQAIVLRSLRTRSGHWAWLFGGVFGALPWWGWLLVILPAGGLLVGSAKAIAAVGAASKVGRTANAEMTGLVLGLLLLALGLALVIALRTWPVLDRATGLLAPVLILFALNMGMVVTAKMAVAEAGLEPA